MIDAVEYGFEILYSRSVIWLAIWTPLLASRDQSLNS